MPSLRSPQKARADVFAMRWAALEEEAEMLREKTYRLRGSTEILALEHHIQELRAVRQQYDVLVQGGESKGKLPTNAGTVTPIYDAAPLAADGVKLTMADSDKSPSSTQQRPHSAFYCQPAALEHLLQLSQQYLRDALAIRAKLPPLAVATASTLHEKLEIEIAKGFGYVAAAGLTLPGAVLGNLHGQRPSFGGDTFLKEIGRYTEAQRIQLMTCCREAIVEYVREAQALAREWSTVDAADYNPDNIIDINTVPTRLSALQALISSAFPNFAYSTVEELLSLMATAEGTLWNGKNAAAREDVRRANDEFKAELDTLERYEELANQNPILVSPLRALDPIDQRMTLHPRPDPKETNLQLLKEKLKSLEASETSKRKSDDVHSPSGEHSDEISVVRPVEAVEVLPSNVRRQLVEAQQLKMQLEFRQHEPKIFEHEAAVVTRDPYVIGDEAFLPSRESVSLQGDAMNDANQMILFSDDAFAHSQGMSKAVSPTSPTAFSSSMQATTSQLDDDAKTFLQKFGQTLFSRAKVEAVLPTSGEVDRKKSLMAQSNAAKQLSTRNSTEDFKGPISQQNKKIATLQSFGIHCTLVPNGEYTLGHLNPKESATLLPIALSYDRSSRLDRRTNYWLASRAPSMIAGIEYEDGPQHFMYTTQPRHVHLDDWAVSTRPVTVRQFLAVTKDTRFRAEMERIMLSIQPSLLDTEYKASLLPIMSESGLLAGFIEETQSRLQDGIQEGSNDTIEVPFFIAEAFCRALGGVVCPPDVWEAMTTGVGGDQQQFLVPHVDDVPKVLGLHQLQWEIGVDKNTRGVKGSSWRISEREGVRFLQELKGQFGHELLGRCGSEWNQSVDVASQPEDTTEKQGAHINLREHFARLRAAARPEPTPAEILDGRKVDGTIVPYERAVDTKGGIVANYTRKDNVACVEELKAFSDTIQQKVVASGLPPPKYSYWRPQHCPGGSSHILRSSTDHMTQTIFAGNVHSITTFVGPSNDEVVRPSPSPHYYENTKGFVGPSFNTFSLPHKGTAVASFRVAVPSCGQGATRLTESLKVYDHKCGRNIVFDDLLRGLGRGRDVIAGVESPFTSGSSHSVTTRSAIRPLSRNGERSIGNWQGRIGMNEEASAQTILEGDGWLAGIEPDIVLPAGPEENAAYSDTHRWVLAGAGLDLCFANNYPHSLRKVVLFGPHKGIRRPPTVEHWMCCPSIRGTYHIGYQNASSTNNQIRSLGGGLVPMPQGTASEGICIRTDSLREVAYTLPLYGSALIEIDTKIRKAHTDARMAEKMMSTNNTNTSADLIAPQRDATSDKTTSFSSSTLRIIEDSSYRMVYTDRVTVRPANDPKGLLPDHVLQVEITWVKRYDITGGGVPIVSEVSIAAAAT